MTDKPTRGKGSSGRLERRRMPRLVQVLALSACCAVAAGSLWITKVMSSDSVSIWKALPQPFLSPVHKPTLQLASDKLA